jgi:hypothetical protein
MGDVHPRIKLLVSGDALLVPRSMRRFFPARHMGYYEHRSAGRQRDRGGLRR